MKKDEKGTMKEEERYGDSETKNMFFFSNHISQSLEEKYFLNEQVGGQYLLVTAETFRSQEKKHGGK